MAPRSSRPHLLRLLAVLAVVGLLAAGCGGGGDDSEAADDTPSGAASDVSEQGDPVAGGSITVGLEAETNSWLPGTANFGNPGIAVALAIFDPLFRRDENGVIRPYLAESIESNTDLTEWTVRLRPDVLFHDGTPFDAAALKTVFDTYIKVPGSNLAAMVADVASLDVVDSLAVVYRLSEPNAAFDSVLAGAVGWPFSPTAAAEAGADAGSHPVGTGPFVFGVWQRDNRLVVS
jgi:peptide/nickel transport system substrate-binding protein